MSEYPELGESRSAHAPASTFSLPRPGVLLLAGAFLGAVFFSADLAYGQGPPSGAPTVKKEAKPEKPVKKAMTPEEFKKRVHDAAKQRQAKIDQGREKPAVKTAESEKKIAPRDLLENSQVLCYRGQACLIPKTSIIHIPESYQQQLVFQRGSKLVDWAEFQKANRAWVGMYEVTLDQARGNVPVDEEALKAIRLGNKIVVSTFKSRPISLLPPKDPALTQGEAGNSGATTSGDKGLSSGIRK